MQDASYRKNQLKKSVLRNVISKGVNVYIKQYTHKTTIIIYY